MKALLKAPVVRLVFEPGKGLPAPTSQTARRVLLESEPEITSPHAATMFMLTAEGHHIYPNTKVAKR